ncbi:MAG TPA: glycosyl hydrolase family 28-related protein [Geminicoccaceae bacterium]|nr:glycosyl hydrolase family 28-related protein [Geminicoccaceae bacterium]
MATRRPSQLPAIAPLDGRAELVVERAGGTVGRATVEQVRQRALLATDFGAAGDGVTDNAAALKAAIDAARASARPLWLPAGTYLVDAAAWGTPPTIDFDLTLIGEAGATLRGTAKHTQHLFYVRDAALDVAGVGFETFRAAFRWFPAPDQSAVRGIRFRDCRFADVVHGLWSPGPLGDPFGGPPTFAGWNLVEVSRCVFDGYRRAISMESGQAENVNVIGNWFLNGEADGIFFGLNAEIGIVPKGHYNIHGNVFRNTHNPDLTSAETHFIRCYGEYASITGNQFVDLNSDHAEPVDVEAVYPKCRHTVIANNVFKDAGIGRGFVSLKSNNNPCVVANNRFVVTDAHKARYATADISAIYVDTPPYVQIIGNDFFNFDDDVILTGAAGDRTVEVVANTFSDCGVPGQALINFGGAGRYTVRGNRVFDDGATPDVCVEAHPAGGPLEVLVEDNRFAFGIAAVKVEGDDAARPRVYVRGNTLTGGTHAFVKSNDRELGELVFTDNLVAALTGAWFATTGSPSPLARRLRIARNRWPERQTTNSTALSVASLLVPDGSAHLVRWRALGVAAAARGCFEREALLHKPADGGGVAQQGVDLVNRVAQSGTWGGAGIDLLAPRTVQLSVAGATGAAVSWLVELDVNSIT